MTPGGASFIAKCKSGELEGFVCRRPAIDHGYHQIGPLYANTKETADKLLQAVCSDVVGETVVLNTWYFTVRTSMCQSAQWTINDF